jgi:RNA polymerase primary sigma factor
MDKNLNDIFEGIIKYLEVHHEFDSKDLDIFFKRYVVSDKEKEIVFQKLSALGINIKNNSGLEFHNIISKPEIKNEENILVDDETVEDQEFSFEEQMLLDEDGIESMDLDEIISINESQIFSSRDVNKSTGSNNLIYLTDFHSDSVDEEKKKRALNKLVLGNRGLVMREVRRHATFVTRSFDMDDMYQEGMVGLIMAAQKFDITMPNQFSTYAV